MGWQLGDAMVAATDAEVIRNVALGARRDPHFCLSVRLREAAMERQRFNISHEYDCFYFGG